MQPSTRKGFGSDIPDFTSFHLRLDAALKKEYARVLAVQDKMSPCLLKAGFISSFFSLLNQRHFCFFSVESNTFLLLRLRKSMSQK